MFDDVNGYTPLPNHQSFLGLSIPELTDCFKQQCPLGMTPPQFTDFKTSLQTALARDGLTDCDVRLKGSSAVFYSGWHKLMPYHAEVLFKTFEASRKRPPKSWELNNHQNAVDSVWSEFLRPLRRPFDSMHRIGIDLYPSDYDVQVSSDQLAARVKARAASLPGGVPDLISDNGGFFKTDIVEFVCPELTIQWAPKQGGRLRRQVAVRAFPAVGPPNQTAKIGHLSSHFRPTDWIL